MSIDERIAAECWTLRSRFTARSGLLESVYESGLAFLLTRRGFQVARQVPIPVRLFGEQLPEGFRADLLVNDRVIVELKAVQALAPVHRRQLLTYLRLSDRWLGLLVNFGGYPLKEGFERIVNGAPRD
jgi:GxxExxY protein